jgi:hypothetical protein
MKKLLVILLFILLAPFGIKAQPTSRKYVNFHMQKLGGTFSYTSGQKPTRFISNGTMQKPVTAIPTAQFNFSSTISTVTGCTNVYGDPTASPSLLILVQDGFYIWLDQDGIITLTAGTTPSTSATVATITYTLAFPTNTFPVLTAANSNAALLSGVTMVYTTGTTTKFTITSGTSALTSTIQYKWYYHCGAN